MTTMDSIQYAFKAALVIGACLVLNSGSVHAGPPSQETFNKASELVLTLSDGMLPKENADRPFRSLDTPIQNNSGNFIARKDHKRPLNMNCGMNTNPYSETDNSFINRLSGTCDLTYNY